MSASPIDKSNMRKVIESSHNQFTFGWKEAESALAQTTISGEPFSHVLIIGMGGSGHAGDLIKTFLDSHGFSLKRNKTQTITVHRDYNLPSFISAQTLIIVSSYSGNTEETLSVFEQATKAGLTTVSMTSGGKLKERSEETGTPCVVFSNTVIQPRNSLGYQFSAIAYILYKFRFIDDMSVNLLSLTERLAPENKHLEKQGEALADYIGNSIPIIYSSRKYGPVANNWKIRFNESAKRHAFYNVIPELNHNELVGYTTKASSFSVFFLKDLGDHERILKRMDLTAKLIERSGTPVEGVEMQGDDMLTKMFSTILLGDWVAYYTAIKAGIDPTPVEMVENLKKDLA